MLSKRNPPGDVIKTMTGDTGRVINTGRPRAFGAVTCCWVRAERFLKSGGVIDWRHSTARSFRLGQTMRRSSSKTHRRCCNAILKAQNRRRRRMAHAIGPGYEQRCEKAAIDDRTHCVVCGFESPRRNYWQRLSKDGMPDHLDNRWRCFVNLNALATGRRLGVPVEPFVSNLLRDRVNLWCRYF